MAWRFCALSYARNSGVARIGRGVKSRRLSDQAGDGVGGQLRFFLKFRLSKRSGDFRNFVYKNGIFCILNTTIRFC